MSKWEEVLCEENGYQLIVEETKFSNDEKDVIVGELVEEVEVIEKVREDDINQEKLIDILKRFVKNYAQEKRKNKNIELEKWLFFRMKEEFPEKEDNLIEQDVKSLISGISLGKDRYEYIKKQRELGITPSDILAKEIAETTQGETKKEVVAELKNSIEITEKENINSMYSMANGVEIAPKIMAFDKMNRYFEGINETIARGNEKMIATITTKAGNINQNPQLDGFIFEQFHENTFNIDRVLKDVHNIRAEALVPKPGTTYAKNSIDLVVKVAKDGKEVIVRKYQAKLSENAKMLYERGNYYFQRPLYGKGQENIGNTIIEYEGISSKALSKVEAKKMQYEVQNGDISTVKQSFKKDVDVKILSKQLARQTMMSATVGMGAGMLFSAGEKIINGEEVEFEDVIVDGLKAGGSVGLSTAIAGGLKTAVEKGAVTGFTGRLLASNNVIGTIAFSAVSLLGVAYSVGSGDMSLKDGMRECTSILAGTYLGIKGSLVGMAIAGSVIATVGTVLAPVGAVVTAVAGTIGYFVGSSVGSALAKGVSAIGSAIKDGVVGVVKAGYEAVKSVASGVASVVSSIASGICSAVSSVCSFIGGFFGW